MTTQWWLVVLVLATVFAFAVGYIVRAESERYRRHVYDLDFTRRRVGA